MLQNKVVRLTKTSNFQESDNNNYNSPIKDISSIIAKDGHEEGKLIEPISV